MTNLPPNVDFNLYVSHVDADGVLLRIFAQTDQETSLRIERMMAAMSTQLYAGLGRPSPQTCLRSNLICCAMFEGAFYRARICSVLPNGRYAVQFIDYGNTEILDPDNIRLIDGIPQAAKLISVPPQGSEYILAGVLPGKGVWAGSDIGTILNNLRYREYPARNVGVVNKYRLVAMMIGGQPLDQLLVDQKLAVPATIDEMFRAQAHFQQSHMQRSAPPMPILDHPPHHLQGPCPPQPMMPVHDRDFPPRDVPAHMQNPCPPMKQIHQQPPMSQHRDNRPPENWRSHPPPGQTILNLRQSKPRSEPELPSQDASVFTFKSRPIEIDTKHEVTISYVEDGPHLFSVQLRSTAEELAVLMHNINSHTPQPLVEPPLIGSVCLGRYSADKRLLRAVVMKVTEHRCKLHYVDYGYAEILPYPEIYQIPAEYTAPAVMAIRFSLYGVNELSVSEEMKRYFKNLVNGRTLLLHVRPTESSSPLIRYGDLYDSGRNVREILRAAFPDEVPPWRGCPKLCEDAQEMVLVAYVKSCNRFYVQLDREFPALENLMGYIAEYVKKAPPFERNQIRPRLHCIAHSKTYSSWSRAEVVQVMRDEVIVFFVDFGNEEVIPITAIRSIRDPAVTQLRAQAIRCILNGYEKECSTVELDNALEAAILDQRIAMLVKNVIPAGPIVELFDPSVTPMENILFRLKQGLANGNVQLKNSNGRSLNPSNISARRSDVKTQSTLGQQQKTKSKHVKSLRDDQTNRSNNSSRPDPPRTHEANSQSTNAKPKTWKDDNEQRHNDNRHNNRGCERERSTTSGFSTNDRFNRDDGRNERFPRDGQRQDRNDRNDRHDRTDDANANVRGTGRGGRTDRGAGNGRFSGNNSRTERNGTVDKSFSDKDSDTSSRGSGRHGKRGGSGGRGGGGRERRDGPNGRTSNSRDNDAESDRSFKTRSNGSSRIRDVRRDFAEKSETKQFDTWANKPTQSPTIVAIPPPNITVGAVKNCEIVFMQSPTDFQVQLCPDNRELTTVMANIEATYQNGGKILHRSLIKPGTDCVAQYSDDDQWYRATVRSVEPTGATVYFVDYGNSETVDFGKIKELDANSAKLAAQAIACKLLAAEKTTWKTEETEKFAAIIEEKTFEAEFVAKDENIYEILLREVVDGAPTTNYVNEDFSGGADLTAAKNVVRNKGRRPSGRSAIVETPDYAPLDQKWTEEAIDPGCKRNVLVTWFTNPDNFYCQILARKEEFRAMMNDMQRSYAKRTPITEPLRVGSAVIAVFSEDGAMYRAEILELNKARGNIVRYVDFGNCAMVEPRNIYRVENKFMKMPKQAVQCALKNVVPANGSTWSKSNRQEIDKCFDKDSYECSFHEIKDDKYVISLSSDGVDVAGQMVEKSLAAFAVSGPVAADNNAAVKTTDKPRSEELPRFDISLLGGQVLRVKVSNVTSVAKFHIQLPSATASEQMINDYMAEKDSKVMPRLSFREVCIGAGCLVSTDEGWRRAVVVNCSRTTGFDARLIDTGANDEIPLDCMLALPSELSVMQNQAVECSLKNSTSFVKADEAFRDRVENKVVIIAVDEVDNNRLIVELYETDGKKIKISPEEPDATICTVCPMPILHSTHKVVVCYAEHSGSIWLKRTQDMDVDAEFLGQLYEYYENAGSKATVAIDALCAAKGSDGNWYRGKIVDSTSTEATVQFIDYGNAESVSLESIKSLEPQFHEQSRLAIEVGLTVTLGGSKDEQQEILHDHLVDKEFTATLYNVRRKWIAELTNEDGKISEKLSILSPVQLSKNRDVQAEITEMIVGGRYKVTCSHADSPAQFWLQRDEEIPTIERNHEKLQTDATDYPSLKGIPELNTLCVAMFSVDEQWYRAEVLDADEDIITIRFIDHGNMDVVDTNGTKIKQIPDSLKATKRYAIKCRLDVIPYAADDWTTVACEYFCNTVTSATNVEALVVADSNPRRVELFIDGNSAVEDLCARNYATKIHTEEDLNDEMIEREIDPRAAYVSHAISPSEFWVQQERYVGDLEVLVDRFMVADMFPKLDEIKEGTICVAKFPEDEGWYRARVVSHGESGTEVIYIDYGNSAVSTEIRAIPEDLAALPPFSKKCCLALPEGSTRWSVEAEIEFVKMAAEGATVFLLDVIEERDGISVVRLTQEDGDIVQRLVELCENDEPEIEERLPPLGEENSPNVLVSHVISPSEFWTQAESAITELEVMGDHLTAAESFLPLETFEEGTICAAKFPEDGQWYRARILSHGNGGTEVLYVDYGNSAITTELRRLPEDIVNIPSLSMCCSLSMPENVASWSKEACEKFIELVDDGITMFRYEIIEKREQTLIKLTLDGKDIVETLSPLCSKTLQSSGDSGETIEAARETAIGSEQPEIRIAVTVEATEKNSRTSACDSDNSDRILSENEERNRETAPSSDTSGIELPTNFDTTTSSYSEKCEISKESDGSSIISETKTRTEATTSDSVSSIGETVAKDNGLEISVPESLPSTVECAETVSMDNGLEISVPESVPSTVDSAIGARNDNGLEISVHDQSTLGIESSTPEVSVAEGNEQARRPKTLMMDKIVPGSVSRGLSQEDLIINQVERRNSVAREDKVVPGGINKGNDLEIEVSTETEVTRENVEIASAVATNDRENVQPEPYKKIATDNRIVAGSVSRGESPVDEKLRCPRSPKTPHSEKLVAGVVNLQEKLNDLEEDESIAIVVEENIPK